MTFFRALSRAFASPARPRPSAGALSYPRFAGRTPALAVYAPPTLLLFSYFSSTAPIHADEARPKSKSSTLFRAASPAALRNPVTNLVFLRVRDDADERRAHEGWVGYFREAGFDCVEMNLDIVGASSDDEGAWSKELEGQLRLLSLQRAPLLFCRSPASTDAATSHIGSGSARASGLVLVVPSEEKRQEVQARLDELKIDTKRNRVLIVVESEGKDDSAIRSVERWITSEGLA